VPPGLDLTGALADVPFRGTACTPDDLDVCVRATGDGPRVLLVGDSQAAMFVTAFQSLAREHDFTFLTNIIRGCGWPSGQKEMCAQEQDTFYREVLPALDVDVVVAVSLSRAESQWQRVMDSPSRPPGETLAELHLRTSSDTAALIRVAGARLVIVKALLGTNGYERNGPDPLDCLARASRLGDCAVVPPQGKPFTDGIFDAIAAGSPDDTVTVDLNPVLCPDYPACRPVIGRTVVWKDPDHVTGTFLDEQRRRLWARLTATGFLG
jgi:SGNH domain (fused to AT3 domains)